MKRALRALARHSSPRPCRPNAARHLLRGNTLPLSGQRPISCCAPAIAWSVLVRQCSCVTGGWATVCAARETAAETGGVMPPVGQDSHDSGNGQEGGEAWIISGMRCARILRR